jgi:NNP family nitrate/nitrite transporter-like MFS transporter
MAKLTQWTPEDASQWEREGKKIANRNLWISVPSLLLAFAVWMYWSIIIVQMRNLGFPFTQAQLYTLPAIAGLAGATLRIPNSFLISLSGGRNVVALTTTLLLLPAIIAGIALQHIDTSYSVFAIAAALSGIGGGNFASSMSNISFFFPKRMQGTALGVNAGIGNLGVSITQVLLPAVMGLGIFGVVAGAGLVLPKAVAGYAAGSVIFIQNAGWVWVPIVAIVSVAAWLGMTNLPIHNSGNNLGAVGKAFWLILLGYAGTALGVWLLIDQQWNMWLVLPITVIATLVLIRYLSPKLVAQNLAGQFAIFSKKHNWVMTWLYVMTFGSFIGYSAAFPKLIQDVFGTLPGGLSNPNAPNALAYAWLGPLVGSLVRPIGGWLSDKIGGAKVTQWSTLVMILAAAGAAYYIKAAAASGAPETLFAPFLLCFLLLFITTGVGNGSTFRMIPIIFEPKYAGPVLGWTSAIGAYGSFIIPKVFGAQIEAHHAEYALYGFIAYYISCLVVNWWYYARKGAEVPC